VLYVDNGQLLTPAGAAAGPDLCLHMIRRDWDSAVAAARLSVMPLEREGGRAQFIVHPQLPVFLMARSWNRCSARWRST
jgi:transcriptional regulator GlxA family with amidase domain